MVVVVSTMLVDSDTDDPMAMVKERLLSSSELLVAQFEAEERPWW